MVKIKVKGWIFDVEEINRLYEYYLKLLDSKDISVGIDDIKKIKSDIEKVFIKIKKTQDDVFDDERPETEEEAKQVLGQEFIDAFENIRKKCDIDEVRLAIHGTNPETAKLIQKQGLYAKTSNYCDTMVTQASTDTLSEYDDYSGLLNWEHKLYKGLVLIGIPKDCLKNNLKQIKPLWEKLEGDYKDTDLKFRIKPEFIIGYLDIDKRKVIQNDLYRVQHNYERLINDTTNEGIVKDVGEDYDINSEKEVTAVITHTNDKVDNSYSDVSFPEDIDKDAIKRRLKNYLRDIVVFYLANIRTWIGEPKRRSHTIILPNGKVAVPPMPSMNDKVFSEISNEIKQIEDDAISLTFEGDLEEIIENTSTHEVNQTTKILSELSRDEKELEDDDLIL